VFRFTTFPFVSFSRHDSAISYTVSARVVLLDSATFYTTRAPTCPPRQGPWPKNRSAVSVLKSRHRSIASFRYRFCRSFPFSLFVLSERTAVSRRRYTEKRDAVVVSVVVPVTRARPLRVRYIVARTIVRCPQYTLQMATAETERSRNDPSK